jgi:hypothetical protein
MHYRAIPVAVLFWLAVLYQSVSFAALPEKAQVVQAEAMTLSGEGWTVREHSPDSWYSGRPVGQMLGGQNSKPAVGVIEALNMTVPGYYAHLSATKDGETLAIPQYVL